MFSRPIGSQREKHGLAYIEGFSCTHAFLIHVAHSPDQHRFVYIAFWIHCCQPEWDKSMKNAVSLTGVLWQMSVHVRLFRQVGIDVISLSDSWSNAHLLKITASYSCSYGENLQCNALDMWFCLRYINFFFVNRTHLLKKQTNKQNQADECTLDEVIKIITVNTGTIQPE